jgi:phosphatidylglycerophosphate synthase
VTPNQVTAASLVVALLAAGCFTAGSRPGYVVGAVLVLSFDLDCADGQLARLTGTFSDLGGWLDAMFDRLKEYAVYASERGRSTPRGRPATPVALESEGGDPADR